MTEKEQEQARELAHEFKKEGRQYKLYTTWRCGAVDKVFNRGMGAGLFCIFDTKLKQIRINSGLCNRHDDVHLRKFVQKHKEVFQDWVFVKQHYNLWPPVGWTGERKSVKVKS